MQTVLKLVKAAALLTALFIVAWSALPGEAEAVTCEGAGHSCHVIIGDHAHHFKVISV